MWAQQSQMEVVPRGNWSAARVTGHRPLAGDSHYRPASTLLDFPRKCLFLSLPRWEVALLLISSLFIKGALEESKHTLRSEGGWAVERDSRETELREKKNDRIEYTVVVVWFHSFFIQERVSMTWNGTRIQNGPLCAVWLPLHNLHPFLFLQSSLAQTYYGADEDLSGSLMITDSFEELRLVRL